MLEGHIPRLFRSQEVCEEDGDSLDWVLETILLALLVSAFLQLAFFALLRRGINWRDQIFRLFYPPSSKIVARVWGLSRKVSLPICLPRIGLRDSSQKDVPFWVICDDSPFHYDRHHAASSFDDDGGDGDGDVCRRPLYSYVGRNETILPVDVLTVVRLHPFRVREERDKFE